MQLCSLPLRSRLLPLLSLLFAQPAALTNPDVSAAVSFVAGRGRNGIQLEMREGRTIDDRSRDAGIAAVATYTNDAEGWGVLHVRTTDAVEPELAMFAAGYLEGYLTKSDIENMFNNTYDDWFINGDPGANAAAVYEWLKDNLEWTVRTAAESVNNPKSQRADYWARVSLVVAQLEGLAAGLRAAGSRLSFQDVVLLNADGDLEELVPLLSLKRQRRRDRCSALVKLPEDRSDILFGHTTFDHYDMMVRSLKYFDLELRGLPHVRYSLSSSPGFLSSIDDFFLTSNGLAVMETTNGIKDNKLLNDISSESVLSWIRTLVACSLATTAPAWATLFSIANSGTYNDQWMIIDLKLFSPKAKALAPETFIVLEQLPNYVEWHDMTQHLESSGYWGSYNVPAFPAVYNRSGFPEPDSHPTAPRARIFQQRQSAVASVEDFKRVLRYNDFENDPLSLGDACNAISSRCDLNPIASATWQLDGGIDAKVSNVAMGLEMNFVAQNGPTTYQQPPFRWQDIPRSKQLAHVGQAKVYDFEWIQFGPRLQSGRASKVPYVLIFVSVIFVALVAVYFFWYRNRPKTPALKEHLLQA
eukprot:TRINITY_DN23875_c0_g2_i2.p1 TRINITY_DN23875_c0_g2~~TRINITY_DN23875_c0_g2_i2.p1  ORF type:complete len:585 (+),score=99.11 TRINITY_DN23875_c0_g2_i2:92-1846(+)